MLASGFAAPEVLKGEPYDHIPRRPLLLCAPSAAPFLAGAQPTAFNSPPSFPPLRDFFPVSRGKCCALSFCVCFFCDLFCSSVPRHHAGQRATLFPHILPPHCLSLGSIRRFDLGAIGCGLFGRRCNTTFKIGNNPTASQCTLKSP